MRSYGVPYGRSLGAAPLVGLLLSVHGLAAQLPDIPLPYPGWTRSDLVDPTITPTGTYDPVTSLWTYTYTIQNGAAGTQDIWKLWVRLGAWTSNTQVPPGWRFNARSQATFDPAGPGFMGTSFHAKLQSQFTGPFWPPSDFQIPPGQALSGFVIESPYPPGYARASAQGYAPVPFPPDPADDPAAYYASNPVPHDTLNSQRRWTIGPTRYTQVVTGGNRRPATDGFLGFMNLAENGSVLIDPAPIALEFSLNGETVFRNTLRVTLNGVDVTSRFHPGPADGADLVGLFFLGSSPLQLGKNVLLTEVEGIVPGTTRTGKDSDRITFTIDPAALSSNALENLPLPEPEGG